MIWCAVPNWPKYEVNELGEVRRSGHILKPVLVQSGSSNYKVMQVTLVDTAARRWDAKVAHIVLITFIGPKPEGKIARHLDDNQANNKLTNLCWGTHKENSADRIRNKNHCTGENNGNVKLTWKEVREIRSLYIKHSRTHSCVALAKLYRISEPTIYQIVTYKTWREESNAR